MADIALPRRPEIYRPALLAGVTIALAVALFLHGLGAQLPPAQWWGALIAPGDDIAKVLVHYSTLPRLVVALLSGGALGLSGVLFQQVLRNPLAEPGTLGVFAGAKLALACAMLLAPGLLEIGQGSLAFLGGAATIFLVLALSWRGRLSPLVVILSGLIVTIYLGAFTNILLLFDHAAVTDIFLWQAGSLNQNNWGAVLYLAPRLLAAALISAALVRPLAVLDLDEEGARSVGVSLPAVRFLAIAVAVLLSAFVVSAVGIIAFIGLAGPAIARHAGARRFKDRLVWGPVFSAGLLTLTDQVLLLTPLGNVMPTGTLTAVLGAPLLLWLLRRLRPEAGPAGSLENMVATRLAHPWAWIAGIFILLFATVWVALALGRVPEGWHWIQNGEWQLLMPWRAPRVASALAAGYMLALAGVLLQRLTGNAMASPELLGISSGAALALIVMAFFAPDLDRPVMILAASGGALLTLLAILSLGRRSNFSPEHMLLAGVALTTIQLAVMAITLLGGDPRTVMLLSWVAGSTYGVSGGDAIVTCALAAVLAAVTPFCARWLAILPLGQPTSQALGIVVGRSRLVILLLTAALTAGATLSVGPLSFIGLMAPHIVRLLGIHKPTHQLFMAGALGAVIMVLADWLGRTIAFPWQVPAGVVATFLGGTYFIWLMLRRRS
jgi:iron complex transport system permease protein